jgi:hypothetical protein
VQRDFKDELLVKVPQRLNGCAERQRFQHVSPSYDLAARFAHGGVLQRAAAAQRQPYETSRRQGERFVRSATHAQLSAVVA